MIQDDFEILRSLVQKHVSVNCKNEYDKFLTELEAQIKLIENESDPIKKNQLKKQFSESLKFFVDALEPWFNEE